MLFGECTPIAVLKELFGIVFTDKRKTFENDTVWLSLTNKDNSIANHVRSCDPNNTNLIGIKNSFDKIIVNIYDCVSILISFIVLYKFYVNEYCIVMVTISWPTSLFMRTFRSHSISFTRPISLCGPLGLGVI